MTEKKTLNYQKLTPFRQTALIIGLILVFDILTFIAGYSASSFVKPTMYWVNTIAFMLVYAIFNSILSIISIDQVKYWGQSIMGFGGICIIGGLLAYVFSGLSIDEAGSFRWLYTVFTMGYILFLAIVSSMKRIVKMAQKEDKRLRGEE